MVGVDIGVDSVGILASPASALLAKVVLIFSRGFSGAKKCLGLLRVGSAFDGVVVIATVSTTVAFDCCALGADTVRPAKFAVDSLHAGGATIVGTNVVNSWEGASLCCCCCVAFCVSVVAICNAGGEVPIVIFLCANGDCIL